MMFVTDARQPALHRPRQSFPPSLQPFSLALVHPLFRKLWLPSRSVSLNSSLLSAEVRCTSWIVDNLLFSVAPSRMVSSSVFFFAFFLGAKGPVSSSCCLLLLGVADAMMIEWDEPLFLCCCSEIMKSWNSSIAADLLPLTMNESRGTPIAVFD